MLFDIDAEDVDVGPRDITLVVCLRAHRCNPWVLARLRRLRQYYDPTPNILIVDFGSKGRYRKALAKICKKSSFPLVHVADYGTYSASLAHNAAYHHVSTEFIFFMDIDFIGPRDLFLQVARTATAASMRKIFDVLIDLPAYHLTEDETQRIEAIDDPRRQSQAVERLGFEAQYARFADKVEFVAPYSNVFLTTKAFFGAVGGYHPAFRGHGSEDFEFFIRCGMYSSYFDLPDDISGDCHGPTKSDFWQHRSYRGFRSLNQHIASRAERAGLKIFHLWHPTDSEGDWRSENDWRRQNLKKITGEYISEKSNLLKMDEIERDKKVLCICKNKEQWGYFIPLRIHGYDIIALYEDNISSIDNVNDMIDNRELDAIAIFNPYMKSHERFLPIFMRARDEGIETIVVERGALPNTIYYAEDVSYVAESFSEREIAGIELSRKEIEATRAYLDKLLTGAYLLEKAASRGFTDRKYRAVREMKRKVVLIPLQLEDDMAVTKFVRGSQSYDAFAASIADVARAHPKALFLVKPHPLSKREFRFLPENIMLADREDNIHSLIDACDAVVCYNSGVGLLAACQGKTLVTVGNAFYNHRGIGTRAASLERAVATALAGAPAPDVRKVEELVGKYLFHRYSWFSAEDDIREFKERKAHGYKGIQVNRSVISGVAREHFWERAVRPFSNRSYGVAMANSFVPQVAPHAAPQKANGKDPGPNEKQLVAPARRRVEPPGSVRGKPGAPLPQTKPLDERIRGLRRFKIYSALYGLGLSEDQRARLFDTPSEFLSKARHPLSRFGRVLVGKHL